MANKTNNQGDPEKYPGKHTERNHAPKEDCLKESHPKEIIQLNRRLDELAEEMGVLLWQLETINNDLEEAVGKQKQARLDHLRAEYDRAEGAMHLEYALFRYTDEKFHSTDES